jgi:hypothetical protein
MTMIFKKILFWTPFVQLFLLMLISFYQHPAADDFAGFHIASKIGIGGAIRSYLVNGTGRFFVVSIFILICSSRFLLDHYFIIPILFFFITYINLFYLIREVWKIFFNSEPILRRLHWLTASFIVLFLTSIEEVSTFFMWITTCCIFLLSFNLFVFYTRWILRFNFNAEAKKGKWLYGRLIVCVILLCGCEETTLYFSLLLNILIFYAKPGREKLKSFPFFLLLLQFVCAAVVFNLPGNQMRAHNFLPVQPFYFSLISAFYQTVFVLFKIFSNPLLWFFAMAGTVAFPLLKDDFQKRFTSINISYLTFFSTAITSLYFFFFFIRHFGNRVVPSYANNLIICYLLMILLIIAISKSYLFNTLATQLADVFKKAGSIIYLSCIFLFVFSGFTRGLIQSMITAPVHNKVLNNQKIKILQAKSAGKMSVSFDNYQDACEKLLTDKYGNKVALFINNYFHFPPEYICARSDVDFSYAAYYGIDTIYTGTKYIVSWDKAGLPLWNVK